MSIADTFDRADSATTLNPASDGGSWTVAGTFGILSNQAYIVTTTGNTIARRNTGQVDADMTLTLNYTGFVRAKFWVAYDPSTDTGYYYQPWGTSGLYKWASGAGTLVGSGFGSTPASGTVVRVTYAHTTGVLTAYHNGTSVGTATDGTPITAAANSWVCFGSSQVNASTGETFDNFSAVSSAASPPKTQSMFTRRFVAQTRASVI